MSSAYWMKAELKAISKALDDPRTDLSMTMVDVIKELKSEHDRLSAENAELIELLELLDPHIGTEWVRLQLRAALKKGEGK